MLKTELPGGREKRKSTEKILGCGEGGHAECWRYRGC